MADEWGADGDGESLAEPAEIAPQETGRARRIRPAEGERFVGEENNHGLHG